jgi:RpiB/LacA/LacB family sugar-phosphate isomerase
MADESQNTKPKKKVFIAADHAGYEMKQEILKRMQGTVASFEDLGTNSSESTDYPPFAVAVSEKILSNEGSLGILVCGSGLGMAIAANKVHGIRAASVSDEISAALARSHNDAQILSLGARVIDADKAAKCVKAFLQTEFDRTNPRHQKRIDQMAQLEQKICAKK